MAWAVAAQRPDRLASLTVLSTPHPQPLFTAADADQQRRLDYVSLLTAPDRKAERVLLADDARRLRALYRGVVPDERLERTIARLSVPGALTATTHWYAADVAHHAARVGPVDVPTLYVWGTDDAALGQSAAALTRSWVRGPYRFVPLPGASHWLPEEKTAAVLADLLPHLTRTR